MANRSNLTPDVVSGAYDYLFVAGVVDPSAAAIRDHLRSKAPPGSKIGSLGTIQRFLDVLRVQKKAGVPSTLGFKTELPPEILIAFNGAIHAAQIAVKSEYSAERDALMSQVHELNAESEVYDLELSRLTEELTSSLTHTDIVKAQFSSLNNELHECKNQLSAEVESRAALQDVNAELVLQNALLDQRLRATDEQIIQLNQRLESQKAEYLEFERKMLNAIQQAKSSESREREERSTAHRQADLLQVKVEGLEINLSAESTRNAQLLGLLKTHEEQSVRLAASEATNNELRVQIEMLKAEGTRNVRLEQIFQQIPVDRFDHRI